MIEEERPTEKGVEFLNGCRGDWEHSLLSHHIAWHLTLYYLGMNCVEPIFILLPPSLPPFLLDLNQIEDLFAEYDKSLLPNISADNVFGLLDASSLLWRLNVRLIERKIIILLLCDVVRVFIIKWLEG